MSDDKLALLIFVVLTITAPVIFVYLTHSSPWSASIKSCNGLAGPFLSSVFLVFGLNPDFPDECGFPCTGGPNLA